MRIFVRAMVLGALLTLAGIAPEKGVIVGVQRVRADMAYDRCMASGGDDDWKCEELLE